MKRVDLIRAIEQLGCVLIRHGGKHDWYRHPKTGISQPVPDIEKSKTTWQGTFSKCFGRRMMTSAAPPATSTAAPPPIPLKVSPNVRYR